jgi:hypothetical protein
MLTLKSTQVHVDRLTLIDPRRFTLAALHSQMSRKALIPCKKVTLSSTERGERERDQGRERRERQEGSVYRDCPLILLIIRV